ncbi:DnaD domain protein [Alkaliphilus transvaalensis]|uniref:DnaD domain protein n=1 Tax=Alkaliphilus transvaalensis TaxID=114628 RepID=UPI000478EAED|nr:DnaD domain protein [Alkaliphilus transvaalensis]
MGFIKNPPSIDLGDTPIENIFIDVYMPMANGTFVKVYLLAYKYSLDAEKSMKVDNMTISKNLNIPLSDVLAAWDFWESKQIIKKRFLSDEDETNYSVEFVNLKQLLIDNHYRPNQKKSAVSSQENEGDFALSTKDLVEANQIPIIKDMFLQINAIINRPLVPNEKRQILEWFHQYNIEPPLIVKAFSYCKHKKNKKNVTYVGGVLRNWYDLDITTVEQLQEYLLKTGERYGLYERVYKALGFNFREPTESDMKIMNKWVEEFKFSLDLILKACENSSKTSNPNINYINSILTDWFNKGIKTIEDISKLDHKEPNSYKKQVSNVKEHRFKTRFHLSESRGEKYTNDEIENILLKKNKKKFE